MCIDWFSIDISDESESPIPGLRVPWAIFLAQNKLPMETWDLVSRLHCWEPLLPSWILNSPSNWRNLWRPSWIWKKKESIVLKTIAYCLSRLLIGFRLYKRPIVIERVCSLRLRWDGRFKDSIPTLLGEIHCVFFVTPHDPRYVLKNELLWRKTWVSPKFSLNFTNRFLSVMCRAEKGRAVKRAVRFWVDVWCGEGLARAFLPRFRCN